MYNNYTATCLYDMSCAVFVYDVYYVHEFCITSCANTCVPCNIKCTALVPVGKANWYHQRSMYNYTCVGVFYILYCMCLYHQVPCSCMCACVFVLYICLCCVLCVFVPSTSKCAGASSQGTPVATKRKSRPLLKRKGQMMLICGCWIQMFCILTCESGKFNRNCNTTLSYIGL